MLGAVVPNGKLSLGFTQKFQINLSQLLVGGFTLWRIPYFIQNFTLNLNSALIVRHTFGNNREGETNHIDSTLCRKQENNSLLVTILSSCSAFTKC